MLSNGNLSSVIRIALPGKFYPLAKESSADLGESKMLLHHPPLLTSASPLISTIEPSPYLTHLTHFKLNHRTPLHSSSPNYKLKQTTHNNNIIRQSLNSSNSDQTQTTEETTKHNHTDADQDEDESYQVMAAIKTMYNDIVILDTVESRLLLLDQTHNIHSIFNKSKQRGYWTDSYWDEFAALPPIIPSCGPIAIYGLGGGTAAHLLLDSYPGLKIEGWEIDGVLVDKARDYLGLKELETVNGDGGVVNVCVGDALTESTESYGKYAGIIVDLFSGGKVLEEMEGGEFWVEMKRRLMPGGRVMVNCGGAVDLNGDAVSGGGSGGDEWLVNLTVKAMWEVFKGELCWKKMAKMEGANYMAMTGEMPDLGMWEGAVPEKLRDKVWGWMPFPNVPSQ